MMNIMCLPLPQPLAHFPDSSKSSTTFSAKSLMTFSKCNRLFRARGRLLLVIPDSYATPSSEIKRF